MINTNVCLVCDDSICNYLMGLDKRFSNSNTWQCWQVISSLKSCPAFTFVLNTLYFYTQYYPYTLNVLTMLQVLRVFVLEFLCLSTKFTTLLPVKSAWLFKCMTHKPSFTHFRHNRRTIMGTSSLHLRVIHVSDWLPFLFMLGISFVMQWNDLL